MNSRPNIKVTTTKYKSILAKFFLNAPDYTLFLLNTIDIGNDLTLRIRLFADDSLLFGVVKNYTHARNLQENLNQLCEWADKWQMVLNPDK